VSIAARPAGGSDPKSVELGRATACALRDRAAAADPQEACVLLEGERVDGRIVVRALHHAANIASEPRRQFEADPGDVLKALRAARSTGRQLVGLWHSHPSGCPRPSLRDLAQLWPGWVLLIGHGRGAAGSPRAFVATDGGPRELPVATP